MLGFSDICRRKHLAFATEKAYRLWIQSYIQALAGKSPKGNSEEKAEAYLTNLARRGVAAATQNQALNAIAFLYREVLERPLGTVDALRVRRPAMVRVALSLEEVRAVLQEVEDSPEYPLRLAARLLYGCGLRVCEALELRIKDVDLDGGRIIVRASKGQKDRVVSLPESVREEMRNQLRAARAVAKADAASGLPVALPTALARKYPNAEKSEGWAWVFPANGPIAHPRTGEQVRWRMHEVNLQRAVRRAALKAGVTAVVTPHVLRHSYATHVHAAGASARDIQEALGHSKLETTMRYLTPQKGGIRSPLDGM